MDREELKVQLEDTVRVLKKALARTKIQIRELPEGAHDVLLYQQEAEIQKSINTLVGLYSG